MAAVCLPAGRGRHTTGDSRHIEASFGGIKFLCQVWIQPHDAHGCLSLPRMGLQLGTAATALAIAFPAPLPKSVAAITTEQSP